MAIPNLKKLDTAAYEWLMNKMEMAMHWQKPAHLQWRLDENQTFQVYTAPELVENRPEHLTTILDHDYDDSSFIQTFWLEGFFQDLCDRYYQYCGEEKFTKMAQYFYKQAVKTGREINRSSIYTRHVPDWGHTLILSMKSETMMCIVPEEHGKSFCIASAEYTNNVITLSHL